jgi:hypothetical protein
MMVSTIIEERRKRIVIHEERPKYSLNNNGSYFIIYRSPRK